MGFDQSQNESDHAQALPGDEQPVPEGRLPGISGVVAQPGAPPGGAKKRAAGDLGRWASNQLPNKEASKENNRMKTLLLALCAAVFAHTPFCQALTFMDDFNRPDSTTVGNGWSDTVGNIGSNLAITNSELTCPSTGDAGIFRPFPFTAPITITARVKEENGFGTLLRRYVTRFVVRNNGTLNHGYGVVVTRSDQNFNNSTVILVEDNTQLAIIPSTFQYGPEIHVSVTFNLDGSVTGIVSEPAPSTNTFSFSFGPRTIQSIGDNFSIANEGSSGPVDQRIDDVVIMSEPGGELWEWPIDSPKVTQRYAAYNDAKKNRYHTGDDLKPGWYEFNGDYDDDLSNYNVSVKAVAKGVVTKIIEIPNPLPDDWCKRNQPDPVNRVGGSGCVDHGLGNTVILYHDDLSLFTLYAHLDSIESGLSIGQTVAQADVLGKMGHSADGLRRNSGFLPHLHLEAKDRDVLSAGRIDDCDSSGGCFWGYIPGPSSATQNVPKHPNWFGYHDPTIFLTEVVTKANVPFPVEVLVQPLRVRCAPEFAGASNSCSTDILTTIPETADARSPAFVATRSIRNQWYQIYLPNGAEEGWSASGWIAGEIDGVAYSRIDENLPQVVVPPYRDKLRADPSPTSLEIGFVSGQSALDPQRFVTIEQTGDGWVRVFTPDKVKNPDGWIGPTRDLNADGVVDTSDVKILRRDIGKSVKQSNCGSPCDLDGDGKITGADASALRTLCTLPRCAAR